MDIVKFLTDQWQLIAGAPVPFLSCAILFFGVGFAVGKLLYGAVAEVAKARLEAARDDLARLEKRKSDELQDATFLRAEVAALRADVERTPSIIGEGPPTKQPGRSGDVHVRPGGEPTSEVPGAGMFLRPPANTVREALEKAASLRKLVFAVIYDPDHPTRSKLSYSLGYFLEYHTTRKLVDEYFVSTVVPVSDVDAKALVPKEDPLENCRWVVLTPSAQVLRSEGVYANPDEGLKRTREVVAIAESRAADG